MPCGSKRGRRSYRKRAKVAVSRKRSILARKRKRDSRGRFI